MQHVVYVWKQTSGERKLKNFLWVAPERRERKRNII